MMYPPVGYALDTDHSVISVQLFHSALSRLKVMVVQSRYVTQSLQPTFSCDWVARMGITGTKGASSNFPYDGTWVLGVKSAEDGARVLTGTAISVFDDLSTFNTFILEDSIEYKDTNLPDGRYLVWTNGA